MDDPRIVALRAEIAANKATTKELENEIKRLESGFLAGSRNRAAINRLTADKNRLVDQNTEALKQIAAINLGHAPAPAYVQGVPQGIIF